MVRPWKPNPNWKAHSSQLDLDALQQRLDEVKARLDKEIEVRNGLVDAIEATDKVKSLIHCLLGFPHLENGCEWHFTLSWRDLAVRWAKSPNTVRSHMRQAAPFIEILGDGGEKNPSCRHTFVLNWLAILNREAALAEPSEGVKSEDGGCQKPDPRVSISTPKGAKTGCQNDDSGCQNEGIKKRSFETQKPRTGDLNIKPQKTQNGVVGGQTDTLRSDPRSPRRTAVPGTFRGTKRDWYMAIVQWSQRVFERNLANPDDLEELYGIAVGLGLLQRCEQNRFRVFASAACDHRIARIRGAVFKEKIAQNDWRWLTQEDEDLGRALMKSVEGEVLPRTAALHDGLPAVEPDERDSQQRALLEWAARK